MSAHEDRRQELIAEIQASDENWREQHQPGSAGCHELLDRTSLVLDLLERYVLEQPACFGNAAWFELASEAVRNLAELYQEVGRVHLSADEKCETAPAAQVPA